MKQSFYLLLICCALVLGGIPVFAKEAKGAKGSRFLEQDQLQFGMDLAAAQKLVADTKQWEIAYRIDTPSTNDLACRYQEDVMYLAQFYQGQCYSVEKRAVVTKDEAMEIFKHYTELLGPTPEITNSRDERLLYGRWTLKDREIELTAYEHHTGEYMAIYNEYDPLVRGEAITARDSEVQSQPTTIDPITGKPVPIKQDTSVAGRDDATGADGEAGTNGEAGAEGTASAGEGQAPAEDTGAQTQPEPQPEPEQPAGQDPAKPEGQPKQKKNDPASPPPPPQEDGWLDG
jgi:hypothetical protein